MTYVMTQPHPFSPDGLGTQCRLIGCWGWVDDPRHLRSIRGQALGVVPRPVILAPSERKLRITPRARRGRVPR